MLFQHCSCKKAEKGKKKLENWGKIGQKNIFWYSNVGPGFLLAIFSKVSLNNVNFFEWYQKTALLKWYNPVVNCAICSKVVEKVSSQKKGPHKKSDETLFYFLPEKICCLFYKTPIEQGGGGRQSNKIIFLPLPYFRLATALPSRILTLILWWLQSAESLHVALDS